MAPLQPSHGASHNRSDPRQLLPSPPHALVMAFPATGHTTPILQLCCLLASRGIKITFVVTENHLASLLETQQQTTLAAAPSLDISLVGIPDGLQKGLPLNGRTVVEYLGAIDRLGSVLERLMEKLVADEPPVSCIMSDCFLPWTQNVADKFQIPRIAFWTPGATAFSIHLHAPMLVEEGYYPLKDERGTEKDLPANIPGLPPLLTSEISQILGDDGPSGFTFQFLKRQFENINDSVWVLVNTFSDLENHAMAALQSVFPKLIAVGPLLPSELMQEGNCKSHATDRPEFISAEDNTCLEWLDSQADSSVLYVAFGTIANLSASQIEQLALGMESSQQPFLRVIRAGDSSESISHTLPTGFLSRTKDRGICVSWVPQLKVLSHPSVGAFLTHCGWNSTLESVCMGVPMIAYPCFGDQHLNSKLIVKEWKVGIDLKHGADGYVGQEEITTAIKLAMEGQGAREMRKRARETRKAACAAMVGEEGGLHTLIQFIRKRATEREIPVHDI